MTINADHEKLKLEALRLEGKPFHRGGCLFQRGLLPFIPDSQIDGMYWGEPQRVFLPRGLAVWGAPPGTMLSFALCGAQLQAVVAMGSVPARFFAQGDSYEQIAKMLDAGAEPPNWCDWDPVRPGSKVRLEFTDLQGAKLHQRLELAMWGIAAL